DRRERGGDLCLERPGPIGVQLPGRIVFRHFPARMRRRPCAVGKERPVAMLANERLHALDDERVGELVGLVRWRPWRNRTDTTPFAERAVVKAAVGRQLYAFAIPVERR